MKTGLSFFPVAVDWLEDNKLTMLIEEFGHAGIGLLVRLLGEIYKNGYFVSWSERDQIKFSRRAGEDVRFVTDVVDLLIKEEFFDQGLASRATPILTSKGIQERWLYASSRRAVKTIPPGLNLLAAGEDELSSDRKQDADNVRTGRKESARKMQAIRKQSADTLRASCQQREKPAKSGVFGTEVPLGNASSYDTSRSNMSATCKQDADDLQTAVVQTKTETETETKTETKSTAKSGGVVFPTSLDTKAHREAWEKFIAHRKAIRKPYRSIDSQNAQLARWAAHPDAFIGAVNAAVANEWTGLHLPSPGKQGTLTGLSAREARTAETLRRIAEEESR